MNAQFDIVVMGAGMVGASLVAAMLDHAGSLDLQIALIEPQASQYQAPQSEEHLDEYQSSFDARSTALSFGSAKIFQQLDIWKQLKQQVQKIEHIHVSDKGHFGATRLSAKQQNVDALGYVVENQWLGETLLSHIDAHPNRNRLQFYRPASVISAKRHEGLTQLAVDSEGESIIISAQLLVMADGGRSTLRETLGFSYKEQSYNQHALICNLEFDRAHKNIAYERFTDTGPIAMLPLKKQKQRHRNALIWTLPDEHVDEIQALDDKAFMSKLQQRFGYRSGRIIGVGQRTCYPLKLQIAQELVRAGVVLVGNAAHTLHPIAGQGFNLALRGVATLAQHLIAASSKGQNLKEKGLKGKGLGDLTMLSEFAQSRQSDQQMAVNFSDKSMHLFSTNNSLLALGRDLGLQLLDICPAAKTVFARSAMGLSSAMPDLQPPSDSSSSHHSNEQGC
jgi:2-octaprenyl-6-methoxyphenol hydroxylase